jgi:hypothetical protein
LSYLRLSYICMEVHNLASLGSIRIWSRYLLRLVSK